jgi:hypothetical protein
MFNPRQPSYVHINIIICQTCISSMKHIIFWDWNRTTRPVNFWVFIDSTKFRISGKVWSWDVFPCFSSIKFHFGIWVHLFSLVKEYKTKVCVYFGLGFSTSNCTLLTWDNIAYVLRWSETLILFHSCTVCTRSSANISDFTSKILPNNSFILNLSLLFTITDDK